METAYQLAQQPLWQQFITMVRKRTVHLLDTWLEASINSEIVDLQNFVRRGTQLVFNKITVPYGQL